MTRLEVDDIDRAILTELQRDGRVPIVELARRVGLSSTPCHRRVRRLEQRGVITGYGAEVDQRVLGRGLSALVTVSLSRQGPEDVEQFLSAVRDRPEIVECLLVAGNTDYVLRVAVADANELRDVLDVIKPIPAVATTSTMLILDEHDLASCEASAA
ncbi:MAG: Lrp/AsnC family transcriptional regulator [Actinomycetota bacterium]